MPQLELPKLESGWLVDAVQQRFPEIGGTTIVTYILKEGK